MTERLLDQDERGRTIDPDSRHLLCQACLCGQCEPDGMHESEEMPFCEVCRLVYPRTLLRALLDVGDYALGLRAGTVVRFAEAELDVSSIPDRDVSWVRLLSPSGVGVPVAGHLDVRLDAIVWVGSA